MGALIEHGGVHQCLTKGFLVLRQGRGIVLSEDAFRDEARSAIRQTHLLPALFRLTHRGENAAPGKGCHNPALNLGGGENVAKVLIADNFLGQRCPSVSGFVADDQIIGGDDTLGVANQLVELGLPMIGVPKTIDNDLNCTDYTFGFDTAANMAMRAMDDLCTTASSHSRVMVVEIMGRNTGWIAVQSAIAANVNVCVIPEFPLSLEEICRRVKKRYDEGKHYSIVALAEATRIKGLDEDLERLEKDSFGNYKYPERNIGQRLAEAIEEKTGLETRHIVLGHLQRSGAPTLFDRVLGTRLGVKAADLAMAHDYGKMVGLAGTTVVAVSLKEAVNMRKEVDAELYEIAEMCCR